MSDTLLFDLGVIVGTHLALSDSGVIPDQDAYDEIVREQEISLTGDRPQSWEPYYRGKSTAYQNTMRPEVLSLFQEVKA